MRKISEIKIPKGVDRIAVKQYDDKIVIEFIHDEPKFGDLAIFWDNDYRNLSIRLYHGKSHRENKHYDNIGSDWDNAVKWDGTKEQFEKVLRGET